MTSIHSQKDSYPLEELFRFIAADTVRHAKFLNTVSMLEYIGARKIMKSQQADMFDMETLTHASEEIRHAWLIKRFAQKLDKKNTVTYDTPYLLCGEQAEDYIQRLDQAVEDSLKGRENAKWLMYLYTSLLIEERADVFYSAYSEILDEFGQTNVLKPILKDESKHLSQMAKRIREVDPDGEERLAHLRTIEKSAFEDWEKALWVEIRKVSN